MNVITSIKTVMALALFAMTLSTLSQAEQNMQQSSHQAMATTRPMLPIRVYNSTTHVAATLIKTVHKHAFITAYLATVLVMNQYVFENPVFSFIYGFGGALLLGPAVKAATDPFVPAPGTQEHPTALLRN